MQPPIDAANLTLSEKLIIMEELWGSLRQIESSVPSPEWHRDVLTARKVSIADGTAGFTDWDQAKEEIRSRCHCRSRSKAGPDVSVAANDGKGITRRSRTNR
ncbi:MAG: addiction module protein [Verrucomicrobia bacterium]|nr:addiction module protein [Verrucomicrobiota bacterium]